ncbi:MAG: tRNA preQ1(34) S-adenosylmethionine ribosyltransferase-isomerase QueA [Elusimicrobia bacterium]|nr:tRNA preQ1(34) S-adenosylmethionine ribosyltransferase-isomerase QueA [Elusimicrobiota bacterium]
MAEAAAAVPEGFRLSDYEYGFPETCVAERPAEPRDSARLLVLDRRAGTVEHAVFRDLPRFLAPGDLLVVNRSRVLPARLVTRKPTGGKVELLLVRESAPGRWSAIVSGVRGGETLPLEEGWTVEIERRGEDALWSCRFSGSDVAGYLQRRGRAPLPPYILKRRRGLGTEPAAAEDRDRYQTVYAREAGSIAAPTAGLHFTAELLERLAAGGVTRAELLLHVGPGTFRPLDAEDVREHRMLPEWYQVSPEAAAAIAGARKAGGRVVVVGTTAARGLESWAATGAPEGWTSAYITPGHRFRTLDAFITNFHLPRSTPLVLASAFAGRERLLAAYREAIHAGYRLYSYGDAMLIL